MDTALVLETNGIGWRGRGGGVFPSKREISFPKGMTCWLNALNQSYKQKCLSKLSIMKEF